MNMIIFGVSGRTGRRLLDQAKAQGHRVTAFARNPDNSLLSDPSIQVIRGDLLDPVAVARATEGQNVILSAVGIAGSTGRAPTTIFSQGMENIVAGARLAGARRIIAVGSSGIDSETKALFPVNILADLVVRPLLRGIYDDIARMETWLANVELDWTVMRPPYLTNGRITTQYRTAINRHLRGIARISRADLAHCMLEIISNAATYRAWMEVAY
jgi:putative NADH-flavin reductase